MSAGERSTEAIRLLVSDIDGTLVLTGGAGARALTRAFDVTPCSDTPPV